MTFRHKEFIRHILLGKGARQAALAAGYARSTAERNAATLLAPPTIQATIARRRAYRTTVTARDLDICRRQMMHIVQAVSDPAAQIRATAQILRIASMQERLVLDEPDHLEEQADQADATHRETLFPELQRLEKECIEKAGHTYRDPALLDEETTTIFNEILAESPDYQAEVRFVKDSAAPAETDLLPDGTPAFDLPPAVARHLPPPKRPLPIPHKPRKPSPRSTHPTSTP